MDYADARRRMVDGQLRPNKVTDPRLLEAMRTLPRERFLPAAVAARAYTDEDVPLPGGRAMMEPMVLARLVQLAALRPGDRALVAGAGTGYGAAVLAHMGARVTALEADAPLLAVARTVLPDCLPAGAVRLEAVDPTGGFAAGAPYDIILIEGEVPEVPGPLADQLAEGGRLVTAIGIGRRQGKAILGQRIGGAFTTTPVFDCAVAPLPAFARSAGFVF
ncbi:protein-L-isoaspartate O-methyltransferase [Belnapia sp. T6]|uniref:Protein-L-isoaspartate O-methyltransferase n=1 Tax=Belnapia mucosa TaxID=2804532 RepID=A0ABS1VB18_9PROT|nr:protein-L-isoaspartate O-methyltransferase [Belnapia mucosa]MBL6457924.1 protein-L-isoaspartate O-methyltransferase [Belnapia mucosa]